CSWSSRTSKPRAQNWSSEEWRSARSRPSTGAPSSSSATWMETAGPCSSCLLAVSNPIELQDELMQTTVQQLGFCPPRPPHQGEGGGGGRRAMVKGGET